VKVIPTLNAAGDKSSRVSAVYDAAPRRSFVAALKDVPEVWEISYDPDAEPIAEGWCTTTSTGKVTSGRPCSMPRRTTAQGLSR
jgi:hypothetical protein